MRPFLSERNIVVVLFVLVLITFSLAHEDSKEMEQFYQGSHSPVSKSTLPVFSYDYSMVASSTTVLPLPLAQ